MAEIIWYVSEGSENFVGGEENAGYQHFFLYPKHFQKFSYSLNSLLNNKISDQFKLKSYAEDKMTMTQKLKFDQEWVENIVRKREKTFFSFFSNVFKRLLFQDQIKSGLWGKALNFGWSIVWC